MREALVFGASGQIGTPLLALLQDAGWRVFAVSRDARVKAHGVRWLRGDLAHVDGLPGSVEAIFSCGPLDLFSQWYTGSTIIASRVIAFGSTSIGVKSGSSDVAERDVASRLAEGERVLFAAATARDTCATLLRPTLVYGAGRDRTSAACDERDAGDVGVHAAGAGHPDWHPDQPDAVPVYAYGHGC